MDDDEVISVTKKEWDDVIRIMREDGIHIHKTYAAFQKTQQEADTEAAKEEATDGKPPPVKDQSVTEPPKKRGLWWGDRE